MKVSTLAVIAIVYLLVNVSSLRAASEGRDGSGELAMAAHASMSAQNSAAAAVIPDKPEVKTYPISLSSASSEPLLLLLLGSTLFVLGSGINLLLTKKINTKPMRIATSGK